MTFFPGLPKEISDIVTGDFPIGYGSIPTNTYSFPLKVKIYSLENMIRLEKIENELSIICERVKFFDGKGVIKLTPFDQSRWTFPHGRFEDHEKNSFVPPYSTIICKQGLESGKAHWYEGRTERGEIPVTKEHMDAVAPYIRGFKRVLFYGALSNDHKDRTTARNILQTEVLDRLNEKRTSWINQGITIFQEAQNIPYKEVMVNPEKYVTTDRERPLARLSC